MNIKEDLKKHGVVQQGHFKLSSGFHSDTYINKDLIYVYPGLYERITDDLSQLIVDTVHKGQIDVVVGLEKGSIPLAGPMGIIINRPFVYADKKGNDFVFRKSFENHMAGKPAVIIEDIITTGRSISKAIKAVEKLKGKVTAIFCIWNRNNNLKKVNGVKIYSLINERVGYWKESNCALCKNKQKINKIK